MCGPQTAAMMVLAGEVLDGETAAEVGLAWQCVDDDRLLDEAQTVAARIASAPIELARRTKRTMHDVAMIDDHDAAVDRELETQVWSMDQPAFAERLAAMQRRISKKT